MASPIKGGKARLEQVAKQKAGDMSGVKQPAGAAKKKAAGKKK